MNDQPEHAQPIYVSYLTFTTLLDWLRETRTVPSQFDRSYWGHKFSGSTGAQLMAGLRFLGLLHDSVPDPKLERLAFASNEERRELLIDLLREAYGTELVDGLAKMTPNMLNERLRALGTTDSTHPKARSFFVNAAKAVGIQMPGQIAKQARNRPSVTRRGGGARRKGNEDGEKPNSDQGDRPPPPPPDHRRTMLEIHPALEPLLRDLARIAPTWDEAQKKRWKLTWDTVLDYAHPVVDADEMRAHEEDEG